MMFQFCIARNRFEYNNWNVSSPLPFFFSSQNYSRINLHIAQNAWANWCKIPLWIIINGTCQHMCASDVNVFFIIISSYFYCYLLNVVVFIIICDSEVWIEKYKEYSPSINKCYLVQSQHNNRFKVHSEIRENSKKASSNKSECGNQKPHMPMLFSDYSKWHLAVKINLRLTINK